MARQELNSPTTEGGVVSSFPSNSRDFKHPLASVLLALGVLTAACSLTPDSSAQQFNPHAPIPTPDALQLSKGRQYKADFERSVREFVGVKYQQYGVVSDPQLSGADSEDYWARSRYRNTVIEFVNTGPALAEPPFKDQSYMVANRYDDVDRLKESFLSTGRIAGSEYNINTLPLIAMGVLPPLAPNSGRMAEQGFARIPSDKLQEVTGTVFNLPPDTKFENIRVCYTFPMGTTVFSTPGLIGRTQLKDGRALLVRSHEGGQANLWVTATGEKQPDIHTCSWLDQQKMAAQVKWWTFRARLSARVDTLLHPAQQNLPVGT